MVCSLPNFTEHLNIRSAGKNVARLLQTGARAAFGTVKPLRSNLQRALEDCPLEPRLGILIHPGPASALGRLQAVELLQV